LIGSFTWWYLVFPDPYEKAEALFFLEVTPVQIVTCDPFLSCVCCGGVFLGGGANVGALPVRSVFLSMWFPSLLRGNLVADSRFPVEVKLEMFLLLLCGLSYCLFLMPCFSAIWFLFFGLLFVFDALMHLDPECGAL